MNPTQQKITFDPHLRLLAQSLIEIRTGVDEKFYLDIVEKLIDHLQLSKWPNCFLLLEKDIDRHFSKYLLEIYRENAEPFYTTGKAPVSPESLYGALLDALKDKDDSVRSNAAETIIRIFFQNKISLDKTNRYIENQNKHWNWPFRQNKVLPMHFVRYIIMAIHFSSYQAIFNTPNAVHKIIEALMNEDDVDRVYYGLFYFNIKKLKLPIALELVRELANPDTEERIKRVIFDLLLRVELIDKEGNSLTRMKQNRNG